MALANFSNAQISAQLNSGKLWSGSTISYRFPTNISGLTITSGEGNAFRAASAAQQSLFVLALMTWDDLIVGNMQAASGTNTNIELAYTSSGIEYAHAYFPTGGTVWLNSAEASLVNPSVASYGFQTMVHEIGHALGLNHMGDYNGAGAFTPSSYQDSVVLSIMSYFGPSAPLRSSEVASADWRGGDNTDYAPQTPMLNDVMVIQQMYGASTTTRIGDTIYGFETNVSGSAASLYDFSANPHPILTLYDSDGNDTLNLSGWSSNADIHLESGVFTSANDMTNNIVIAYSATIENAVGGSGNDTLTGNAVGNKLDGGGGVDVLLGLGGDDTLIGGTGNDQVDGGDGADTAVLSENFSSYTFTYDAIAKLYTVSGLASGTDSFTNVEYFQFADVLRAAGQLISGDTTAPTLVSTNPTTASTAVPTATHLVLTFNEAVAAGSGFMELHLMDGSVALRLDVTDSSQVSFSGSTVTLNPSVNLNAASTYYLTIANGAVRDTAGNAFSGINADTTYRFTTASATNNDTTAPTLVSSSPADNGTNVPTAANLTFTFSEAIQTGQGNILIHNSDGTLARTIAIADTNQASINANTLTLNPSTDLSAASSYYVLIGNGVIRDIAGNPFSGINSSSALNFTTIGATSSSDDYPWNTATTGSVTVNAGASKGTIELTEDADLFKVDLSAGSTYVFTLSRALQSGLVDPYLVLYSPNVALLAQDNDGAGSGNATITYTAVATGTYYLGAMDFGAGVGAYNLSARSGDTTAPTLLSSTPTDNAKAVPVTTNLTLTFSEAIQAGAGTLLIYNSNGSVARSVSVQDSTQVSIAGSTLTLNLSADLASGSDYYLNMASGVVKDAAGNAFIGISDANTLNFTTDTTTVSDDYPMSLTTTGIVSVDGPATTGSIDYIDDGDLFKVNLVKGQSYGFSALSGTSNGLADPYLTLYNKSGTPLVFDDDGGSGLNASLNYTATETATYFLSVFDAGSGIGRYQLQATTSVDDYSWDTATSGVLTPDAAAVAGVINTQGDADLFKIVLVAGSSYTFELVQSSGGLPDPYLYLYGPDLTELAFDDDSGGNHNASITFTATTNGTHYLGAMDYGSGTGAYTLSARVSATLPTTGTPTADNLSGTSGADLLTGLGGNDWLTGKGGDDRIDGGGGIDHAYWVGNMDEYVVTATSVGLTVRDTLGLDGTDTLVSIERLEFADFGLALDMGVSEGGGKAALLIGAVIGTAGLQDLTLVGQVLKLFDDGSSLASMAGLIVSSGIAAGLAGGSDNAHFVHWMYHNVVGLWPDNATSTALQDLLNAGYYTQASMLAAVAELPVNQWNVNLTGLSQTGMLFL